MANDSKKQYTIQGKIVGTYGFGIVDIDVLLTDDELERIKTLIKQTPECNDFREVIKNDFPELYDQIDSKLSDAAYEYYEEEYMAYYAESDDDEPGNIELFGNEYSCPIPKEWPMKFKFQVMVALTYEDKDIEVEVKLTEDEVNKIRELVAASAVTEEIPQDENDFVSEPDLLQILEDGEPKLFKKFWDVIMPPVFVEILINGIDNGDIEQHEDDNFFDYHEADFDELYDMYCDQIELEHSSCCICKVPKDWLP